MPYQLESDLLENTDECDILLYHVASGNLSSTDVVNDPDGNIPTALVVDETPVNAVVDSVLGSNYLNEARIVTVDVPAGNGTVHPKVSWKHCKTEDTVQSQAGLVSTVNEGTFTHQRSPETLQDLKIRMNSGHPSYASLLMLLK